MHFRCNAMGTEHFSQFLKPEIQHHQAFVPVEIIGSKRTFRPPILQTSRLSLGRGLAN